MTPDQQRDYDVALATLAHAQGAGVSAEECRTALVIAFERAKRAGCHLTIVPDDAPAAAGRAAAPEDFRRSARAVGDIGRMVGGLADALCDLAGAK